MEEKLHTRDLNSFESPRLCANEHPPQWRSPVLTIHSNRPQTLHRSLLDPTWLCRPQSGVNFHVRADSDLFRCMLQVRTSRTQPERASNRRRKQPIHPSLPAQTRAAPSTPESRVPSAVHRQGADHLQPCTTVAETTRTALRPEAFTPVRGRRGWAGSRRTSLAPDPLDL